MLHCIEPPIRGARPPPPPPPQADALPAAGALRRRLGDGPVHEHVAGQARRRTASTALTTAPSCAAPLHAARRASSTREPEGVLDLGRARPGEPRPGAITPPPG